VRISRAFYLGAFEVTQQEFQQVLGVERSRASKQGVGRFTVDGLDTRRFPAERVSRNDAIEFCRKLSAMRGEKSAGRSYRLPTEAEWEYACRAGRDSVFGLGNKLSSSQANFNGGLPFAGARKGPYVKRPVPVGSYKPNPWGLYDMHGNVWEWCADPYDGDYYRESPEADPTGPPSGRLGVIRGGSWVSSGATCRSANRHFYEPEARQGLIGFRVVCEH